MTDQLRLATQAIAAGSDTQLQYNSSGSVAASANLFWLEGAGVLNLSGTSTQLQFYCDGGAQMLFSDAAQSVDFAQISFDTALTDSINIRNFTNDGAINLIVDSNGAAPTWAFSPNGGLSTNAGTSALAWDATIGVLRLSASTANDASALLLRSDYTQSGSITFTDLADVNFCEIDGYSDGHLELYTGTGNMLWNFSAEGGLALPNLATQPVTPSLGEIIYNSTLNKLQVWTGAWETVTSL